MLNIISKAILSKHISGPKKVVDNLTKGLDLLGYPYVVNKDLNSCQRLWVHDDINALKEIKFIDPKIKVIVGPNLFILPRNIPTKIDLTKVVYIQPSPWACDFWKDLGFNKCQLDFWPAGIETEVFFERKKPESGQVLIYFKQRYQEELKFVKNLLEQKNIPYDLIVYGAYQQDEYLNKLKNTKYIIWVGRQETQGIALEEALSMNIPILVWDVKTLGHWSTSSKEMSIFNQVENDSRRATSAAYFDDCCGIKIKDKLELAGSIDLIEKNWKEFTPRQYILENLSLKKQAQDFINLYKTHFGLTYDSGLHEKLLNNKKWKNSQWYFILYIRFKDFIKKILKK